MKPSTCTLVTWEATLSGEMEKPKKNNIDNFNAIFYIIYTNTKFINEMRCVYV